MGCRSGHYYVIFGYALAGGADRPMSVTVNEEVVDGYMSFPSSKVVMLSRVVVFPSR